MTGATEQWSSRAAFVAAAVGSAVGLGNFWRFSYVAGENGGGAFVIVYILAAFFLIAPILLAEFVIGRRGGGGVLTAPANVARESGRPSAWVAIGWLGILAAAIIPAFYIVVAGWVLAYIGVAASGALAGISGEAADALFSSLLADPVQVLIYQNAFLAMTFAVVAAGVHAGLERVNLILVPTLFLALVGLGIYAASVGDQAAAIDFLFRPDWSELTAQGVLAAIGQGFFSISVGMGAMMTFGAYAPRSFPLPSSVAMIVVADTLVALLAGLAIFPIVFGHGLDPASGPGLMFVTLPVALGALDAATLVATIFFVLLFFAALTSAISLMEVPVAVMCERGFVRWQAAALVSGVYAGLGILCALSFSTFANVHPLGFIPTFEGRTWFDIFDFIGTNILLPLGGILIAALVGWGMVAGLATREADFGDGWLGVLWLWLLRTLCPVAVGAVLIVNLVPA